MRESGRFSIHERPMAFPHTEIVNNTPDGPVFDIGVDLDMRDGVVYIKVEHVIEMAEMLGMATKDEVAALKDRIKELTAEVEVLPDRIGVFENELSELVDRFRTSLSDPASSDNPVGNVESNDPDGKKSERTDPDAFKIDGQKLSFGLFKGPNDLSADSGNESNGKPKPKG